jgi:hypothetical protein
MTVNEELDLVRSCVETAQAYLDDECKPLMSLQIDTTHGHV